jgi:hypothetical protein
MKETLKNQHHQDSCLPQVLAQPLILEDEVHSFISAADREKLKEVPLFFGTTQKRAKLHDKKSEGDVGTDSYGINADGTPAKLFDLLQENKRAAKRRNSYPFFGYKGRTQK